MADKPGFPESFKDPLYAQLDAGTEQKLGLPAGLLSSVRTNGERSNHSATNDLGTKTVYQFTPATRKAILDKYGLDVTLSPQNASEGAGLLLQEGVKRNNGDPAAAVGEYIGGTDRQNWGTTTKAYVNRVMAGRPKATAQPSTFDRVKAQADAKAPDHNAIANVFAAYQGGQMTADEAKQFEADVKAGHIMLPRGATLNGPAPAAAPAGGAMVLPAAVVDAYAKGQMTPQDKAQLESDLKAGLVSMPPGVALGNSSAVGLIPGRDPNMQPAQAPAAPEPGMIDRLVGAGEAGLNVVTGATGGALGMAGGFAGGLAGAILSGQFGTKQAADMVEQSAMEGAQALTYQPRTPTGQQYAQNVGEVMAQAIPVMPLTGELAALHGARPAAPAAVTARAGIEGAARDAANLVAKPAEALGAIAPGAAGDAAAAGAVSAGNAVASGAQRVAGLAKGATTLPRRALAAITGGEDAAPTPSTLASGGSAGTDMAAMRQANAEGLPVPIKLTKGQADRSFEQQRFEQETAKDPSAGAPLRERYAEQNDQLLRNFDNLVDQTGAEAPSLRAVGASVDGALVQQVARDKAAVRAAYKSAEKAGELESPVSLDSVVAHLNDSAPDAATAPLLDVARKRAIQLGLAQEGADGALIPQPVTLKAAETFRQAIGRATDFEPTNVRQATILKGLVDEATDGMGGNLYKQARALRARFAQNYEDRAAIAKLLNNKRGMADRQVALEDVFNHTMLNSSLDDVRNIRRVLQRSGDEGGQAWRDLQGQTMQWIKDQATKNVATDIRGNQIVSAAGLDKAVKTLDHDGKLDFIFGKKGAETIRDLNDLTKVVHTAPPGSVNTSNTASVLLAAISEAGATGALTGLPVPVLSGLKALAGHMKQRRLQAKVQEALGNAKRNPPALKSVPRSTPSGRTTH
jgi:hypothetical protein